jgi:hypothetical protein
MLQAGRSLVRVPDEVDFFNLPNTSSRTVALGSTQPLTEMSTRNLPGGKMQPARRADILAAICEPMSENVGASTSRNPKGLHGLYRDNFTLPYLNLVPSPAQRPNQPRIQWVPWALSPRMNSLGHEADNSPSSSAEDRYTWSHTSTPHTNS